MEPSSNISLAEDTHSNMPSLSLLKDKEAEGMQKDSGVLEFSIFQGEDYLGRNCFNQEKVTVGTSEKADLVLNGRNISDIHAFFLLKGDHIFVSDENLGSGIIVNDKFVSECLLKPHDQINIGPFTLKIKIKKISNKRLEIDEPAINTNRVYKEKENESEEDQILASDESATNTPDIYKEMEDESKESLTESMAHRINEKEDSGEEELEGIEIPEPKDMDFEDSLFDRKAESQEHQEHEDRILTSDESDNNNRDNNEDEEKEGSFIEKAFSLKENLPHFMQSEVYRIKGQAVLEVIKCRGKRIIDICFLKSKEKYYSMNECGRFCLAENKDSEICYFYFNDRFKGKVQFSDNYNININELCVPENLYGKRKKFYRRLLPMIGFVSISDGYYEYYLGMTLPEPSPEIFALIEQKPKFMIKIKHFLKI